jgi:Cu/Ag efflux protein CusF
MSFFCIRKERLKPFRNITSNEKKGGDTVKNMIKVLIVAVTSLAFSGVSFAQAKPAMPATPSAPAMEKKTEMRSEKAKTVGLTGEVTSVDAKAGTLTVKGKDKEINLAADSKSTKAAVEKLKVGDMVRLSYTEKDGKMIVSSVKAAKSDKATEKKGEMTEKKPK